MTAQLMVQPSSFMRSGIRMSQVGDVYLFKLTDDLQDRLEELLDWNKQDILTQAERAELDGLSDLSRIFTFINAQLANQANNCPSQLEAFYDDAPAISAHPATANLNEAARPLLSDERDTIKQWLRVRFAYLPPTRSLVDELVAERRQAAKRETVE